jgi:hypothetical protein
MIKIFMLIIAWHMTISEINVILKVTLKGIFWAKIEVTPQPSIY